MMETKILCWKCAAAHIEAKLYKPSEKLLPVGDHICENQGCREKAYSLYEKVEQKRRAI